MICTALGLNIILFVLIGCGVGASEPIIKYTAHKNIAATCPSTIPSNTPASYWPLDTQNFQGIYQFTGQANKKNANNSAISGADLEWSWAKIETTEGKYNWMQVDQDINTWTSTGKSVILRFSTGGQANWSGSVDGSYTPSWVFDTYGVPRITETNGTVFPEYWNPVYLQKLAEFVNAAAARYDNNPKVAAVEIGIGQGGETEPDGAASNNPDQLQLWQQYGYTNTLWWRTVQDIVGIYKTAWKHTPLALMVTSTFLQYDDKYYNRALVEKYAVSQGLLLQINSLDNGMPSSILNGMNQFTTTVEEQKQSAKDSGYPAIDDVKHAIALGARYVLVFSSDLADPSNADALTYAQQHMAAPLMQDCSGNGLTLSVTGRVMPVPGSGSQQGAYAQFFDGSTGTAFGTQAPVSSTATWSLEAWLYPTQLPQTEAIAVMDGTDSGGFGLGIAGGRQGGTGSHLVAYFPGVGWIDSGYTFQATRQWYHVVVTRDGSRVRFYVNGIQTTGTSILIPLVPVSHFSIGSSYDLAAEKASHFYTGAIDQVSIYTSALSHSQVQAHYKKRG